MPPRAPVDCATHVEVGITDAQYVMTAVQQFPGTHDPAQHSSAEFTVHTESVAATAQPLVAATHAPVLVLHTSPPEHCVSLVQPPQTFGVVKPHVGVGAEQSVAWVAEVQLPGTHEPATHTYGAPEPWAYAVSQFGSSPVPPEKQLVHTLLTVYPLAAAPPL